MDGSGAPWKDWGNWLYVSILSHGGTVNYRSAFLPQCVTIKTVTIFIYRSYCGQPPCGQLNPINNYTYLVLSA